MHTKKSDTHQRGGNKFSTWVISHVFVCRCDAHIDDDDDDDDDVYPDDLLKHGTDKCDGAGTVHCGMAWSFAHHTRIRK